MTKTTYTTIIAATLIVAMSVIAMSSAFAATNTPPYEPTMMSDGHQVFYIVFVNDNDILPATAAERIAIDKAIADGTIERWDHQKYLARDVQ
jgi:hypothetical protein